MIGKNPQHRTPASGLFRQPVWRWVVCIIAAVATLFGGVSVATAASQPQYLQVQKSVDGLSSKKLRPGEPFTYQINVKCSENDCLNATLVDPLPAQLQGFAVTGVELSGVSGNNAMVATWTEDGKPIEQPTKMGSKTQVKVEFHQPLTLLPGSGLANGTTALLNITLQVPDNFSPDDPRNGETITNKATAAADNSADASDQADVEVSVEQKVNAGIDKSWNPSTAVYGDRAASTITLKTTNESNVSATTMITQDPQDSKAANGASQLDDNNPFRVNDFGGFGTASLPQGATAVQVDAYVFKNGQWAWTTGVPGTEFQLPSGVSDDQVGGLRFTYTGTIPSKQGNSVDIKMVQRATDRNNGADLSTESVTVDNVAQAMVKKDSISSDIVTDHASRTVTPATISTTIDKSMTPSEVVGGDTAKASITATNTGSAVHTWKISDPAAGKDTFFTNGFSFNGFNAGIKYPANATTGKVVYHLVSGDTREVPFTSGDKPNKPADSISGFDLIFSAADGINGIQQNASVTATYDIGTLESQGQPSVTGTNSADSTVTAVNGQKGTKDDDAYLKVIYPAITATLDKTVRPGTPVQPGQSVITSLQSNMNANSESVKVNNIVVQDSWNKDDPKTNFWDAFNLASIAPTQVPAKSKLTVEIQKSDGSWITLDDSFTTGTDAANYSLSAGELAAKLPNGVDASSVQGVRFTFASNDPSGYGQQRTVTPNLVFTARATLRSNPETSVDDNSDGNATSYTNTAITTGTGKTQNNTTITGKDSDTGTGKIITYKGESGKPRIAKAWDKNTVKALTGDSAKTTFTWDVAPGFKSATITDPVDSNGNLPTDVSQTVFNAFNLVSIDGVNASDDPFSNGWAMKYDTVQSVELFNGTDWVDVPAPAGAWQEEDGSFKGYTLGEAQQLSTTAVRVTLIPNDARRTADHQAGKIVPEPGSGITAMNGRMFAMTWQLRDQTRSDESWITEKTPLNMPDSPGFVNNIVGLTATKADGTVQKNTGSDSIAITGGEPAVAVDKAADKDSVLVPAPGVVDEDQYPTNGYTLTAKNSSTDKANYVRVTDPAPCSEQKSCQSEVSSAGANTDPFTGTPAATGTLDNNTIANPFNRQNITDIDIKASIPAEVDLSKSTVWLLKYTKANGFSTQKSTASLVNDMESAALVDVVGVSVTFVSTSPDAERGTITQANNLTVRMDTQVRSTLRTTGEAFIPTTAVLKMSSNQAFAQSYDLVVSPQGKTGALDSANVAYGLGSLNVTARKTIADGTIERPQPGEIQTVTLSGDQGTSTVAPDSVTVTDGQDGENGSPSFWDNFNFTGLDSIDFPEGSNQVKIGVYGPFGTDGAMDWKDGVAQAHSNNNGYTLPVTSEQYKDIAGVRFVFTKADNTIFSTSDPRWSAKIVYKVVLRDKQRTSGNDVVWPGKATNKVVIKATSPELTPVESTATADVNWVEGTHKLAIDKWANEGTRSVPVGSLVPWDITIHNAGTGYLDLTTLTDSMSQYLLYTGEAPVKRGSVEFTPGTLPDNSAGTLTTKPEIDTSHTSQSEPQLILTWPEGKGRMQPGETAKIRIYLELQPGLSSGDKAWNTATVTTVQKLDSVTDAVPGNANDENTKKTSDNSGETKDYVSTTPGKNLYVVKGVRGSLDGAVNTVNAQTQCTPTLLGPDKSMYYRSPCAANSTLGGVDHWLLHTVNAGTTGIKTMTIFDSLPADGDLMLIAGESRGSTYRPELLQNIELVGEPEGTVIRKQVTESPSPCKSTWNTLDGGGAACEQNGETWTDVSDSTDWSKITGVRVVLDFTKSTTGLLQPGKAIDITYASRNNPRTDADKTLATNDIPAADQYAWNQYGLQYTGDDNKISKITPSKVGVHLRTGSIKVVKKVTFAGISKHAPDKFTASMSCKFGDTTLTFDGGKPTKTIELVKAEDGTYTPVVVNGIPVGATCTIAEDGETGHFGETTRSLENGTVTVETPDPTDQIPASQVTTLTNEYYDAAGEFTPRGVKKLVNRAPVSSDTFSFTVKEGDKQVSTGSVADLSKSDKIVFAPIKYAMSDIGTHTYTVTEDTDHLPNGVSAAPAQTFTVKVTDNGDGTLKSTPTYPEEGDGLEFVNTYDASGSFAPQGVKSLEGRNPVSSDSYKFTVKDKDGATVSTGSVADLSKSDKIVFAPIKYTLADAGKTFQYTVAEDATGLPAGVSATTGSQVFTVKVTDNGDGTLKATPTYPKDGDGLQFVNTYSTSQEVPLNINGTKLLLANGTNTTIGDFASKFSFSISGVDDAGKAAPLPADADGKTVDSAVNDKLGNIDFGRIVYTQADLADAKQNTDGSRTKTFHYTVQESEKQPAGVTADPSLTKKFDVVVTDDGVGRMTAVAASVVPNSADTKAPEGGALFEFSNTYTLKPQKAAVTDQLTIMKKLINATLKDGQFRFTLTDAATGKVLQTVSNKADGAVKFDAVEYAKPGVYEYKVAELVPDGAKANAQGRPVKDGVTYDPKIYGVKVTVTDNHDGTLSVKTERTDAKSQTIEFVNTASKQGLPKPGLSKTGSDTAMVAMLLVLAGAAGLALIAAKHRRSALIEAHAADRGSHVRRR
ncbi:MAG: DUF5979 domain-containing protein [Bifidobacterium sp.]|jgi:pilin isopeptide linkage protein|nr:DUF5979 domain-containing protein [Bifidobacterium sp.]